MDDLVLAMRQGRTADAAYSANLSSNLQLANLRSQRERLIKDILEEHERLAQVALNAKQTLEALNDIKARLAESLKRYQEQK